MQVDKQWEIINKYAYAYGVTSEVKTLSDKLAEQMRITKEEKETPVSTAELIGGLSEKLRVFLNG